MSERKLNPEEIQQVTGGTEHPVPKTENHAKITLVDEALGDVAGGINAIYGVGENDTTEEYTTGIQDCR